MAPPVPAEHEFIEIGLGATCKIDRTRDFFIANWLAVVAGQAGAGVKGPTRNI
jgi:hypothetical protein